MLVPPPRVELGAPGAPDAGGEACTRRRLDTLVEGGLGELNVHIEVAPDVHRKIRRQLLQALTVLPRIVPAGTDDMGPPYHDLSEAVRVNGNELAVSLCGKAAAVHPLNPENRLRDPLGLRNLHQSLRVLELRGATDKDVGPGGSQALWEELVGGPQRELGHGSVADLQEAVLVSLDVVVKEGVRHEPPGVHFKVQLHRKGLRQQLQDLDVRLVNALLADAFLLAQEDRDLVPELDRKLVLENVLAKILALLGPLRANPS
mmetsp:Transcript_13729/g.37797  ORF Transcript_13729/g.37797 Transcript_13729/m.37797 type:complete len:260 (+) Transcript_13729:124-903(+)